MTKTIDVNMLNPFVQATLECLTQMAGTTPERVRLFIKTDPTMHGEIAGIIGLSNGITGSCVVSFPQGLAKRLIAQFLKENEASVTDAMVLDGIGEVANMVAGCAKRLFAGTAYRFDISTPTVIAGANTQLFNPVDVVSIACEFKAYADNPHTFMIEVALKPAEKD